MPKMLISCVHVQQVAQQFVKLFYTILNTHPEHLFHFYGQESNLIVTESREGCGTPLAVVESNQQVCDPG